MYLKNDRPFTNMALSHECVFQRIKVHSDWRGASKSDQKRFVPARRDLIDIMI